MALTGWLEHKEVLTSLARKIEPHVVLVSKRAWPFVISAWVLFIITFGRFPRKKFYDEWATTLGPLIGMPECWDYQTAMEVVIHESRHARQGRWCGFGLTPWIGFPILFLVYIVIFFPVFLAFGRYWMELDADAFAWKYYLEKKQMTAQNIRDEAKRRAESISSIDYYWAVPKSVALRGYQKRAEKVIAQQKV